MRKEIKFAKEKVKLVFGDKGKNKKCECKQAKQTSPRGSNEKESESTSLLLFGRLAHFLNSQSAGAEVGEHERGRLCLEQAGYTRDENESNRTLLSVLA